jgi:glycosyltransferase involved in cell wall biosynthesis
MQPLYLPRRGFLERYALTHWYHAIVANSRYVAERVSHALPAVSTRLHVVLNGIPDTARAQPATLRRDFGIPDTDRIALVVGGVEHRKGFDLVIEAIAHVPGVHAVLAGPGSDAQRDALLTQAAARHVSDRIHLLGPRSDVPALLAASDVFVLASRSEGFSVAMLEAMRECTPVVATDVGGAWEALAPRDGRPAAGLIVPPDDAAALADAIDQVVRELGAADGNIEARTTEARWRIDTWFTIANTIDGYEKVLAAGHE